MPDYEMPNEASADEDAASVADSASDLPSTSAADAGDAPTSGAGDTVAVPARRGVWRRIRVPVIAFTVGVVATAGTALALDASRGAAAREEIEGVTAGYVRAIESGDVGLAAAMVPLDDSVADAQLVDAAITPAVAAEVECGQPQLGAGIATVRCEVQVGGQSYQGRLVLERLGEQWQLSAGLEVAVRLRPTYVLVETVAGVSLEPALARGQDAFWMLPGLYAATIRTPEAVPVDSVEGLVVTPDSGTVRWVGQPSAQLDVDARAAALAFAAGCVTAPVADCPPLATRDDDAAFDAFATTAEADPDDPYAITYVVSLRRPAEDPMEFVLIDVRVDFGEELDRYDLTAAGSLGQ